MELATLQNNLNEIIPSSAFADAVEWPSIASKAEYRNKKYSNLELATPVLQPAPCKFEIPPLEGFPQPAIPVNADAIFNLSRSSKYVNYREMKGEMRLSILFIQNCDQILQSNWLIFVDMCCDLLTVDSIFHLNSYLYSNYLVELSKNGLVILCYVDRNHLS